MQHVLVGKADGAVHLVRDACAFGGGLAGADFRRCCFEQNRVVESVECRDGVGGGTGGGERGRGFAGKPREVLLHRLEFADGTLEGDALVGVSDAHRQHRFQARRRSRRCARSRPSASAPIDRNRPGPARCGSASRARSVTPSQGSPARFSPSLRRQSAVLTKATVAPLPPAAMTAMCSQSRAKGMPRHNPLKVPSAFNVTRSRGRAGATVIAPVGASISARASSQPASSVSASGTGTA